MAWRAAASLFQQQAAVTRAATTVSEAGWHLLQRLRAAGHLQGARMRRLLRRDTDETAAKAQLEDKQIEDLMASYYTYGLNAPPAYAVPKNVRRRLFGRQVVRWLTYTAGTAALGYVAFQYGQNTSQVDRGEQDVSLQTATYPPSWRTDRVSQLTSLQILGLLPFEDDDFALAGCSILQERLARKADILPDLVAQGLLEALLRLIMHDEPRIQRECAHLMALISQLNPSLAPRIVRHGGLSFLVRMSQFPQLEHSFFSPEHLKPFLLSSSSAATMPVETLPEFLASLPRGKAHGEVVAELALFHAAMRKRVTAEYDLMITFDDPELRAFPVDKESGPVFAHPSGLPIDIHAIRTMAILSADQDNALAIVRSGALMLLAESTDMYPFHQPGDVIATSIAEVIANVALVSAAHSTLLRQGWFTKIVKWSRSKHVPLRMQAFRALRNMQARAGQPQYARSVVLAAPGNVRVEPSDLDAKIDVVFVHGIYGNPIRTFRSGTITHYTWWPSEWLLRDVPGCRVMSLSYHDALTAWTGTGLSVKERATLLLQDLQRARVGVDRPVVFVAHSLGGVLVKQLLMLADSEPATRSLAENTRGIVFYATPHRGGGSTLSHMYRIPLLTRPTETAWDVKHQAPTLEVLHNAFRERFPNLPLLSFAESEPLLLQGWPVIVVPQDSANPGSGRFLLQLGQDHAQVCKPSSQEDPRYTETRDFIRRLAADSS